MPPAALPTTIAPTGLTLVKQVSNDNGGTALASAWTLSASGPTPFSGPGPSVSSRSRLKPALMTLSESGGPPGYSASAWVCVGGTQNDGDTITLALGESATCTITNDDITPTLTVIKTIINDNGGSVIDEDAFGLKVDGGAVLHSAAILSTPATTPCPRTVCQVTYRGPGAVTATPMVPSRWRWTRMPSAPLPTTIAQPGLTLVKQVSNDNGGAALASAWTLSASGPTPFSGPGPSVSSPEPFETGSYTLSESGGPPGYSASAWVCVGGTQNDGDTITLALGESATCTITNDDITPTLTVIKTIVNDNGGSVIDEDAFGLKVDGGAVLHSVSNNFNAGNHTVVRGRSARLRAGTLGR